jgi:hypothetical protein
MSTLSIVTLVSLLSAQELRPPSGPYHAPPDTRRPASEATAAPEPSSAPRAVVGARAEARPDRSTEPTRTVARLATRCEGASTLHFDVDCDGRHWVRGAGYKASFGVEGATFVPFLGSGAPQNQPVRFALAAATQGAVSVELRSPEVARDGDRIVLDHGAVRAEYVPLLHGLEQLFVLDAPLASGDLVLDLALATDLVLRADGAGWRFVGERGGVVYGAAIALGAGGERLALRAEPYTNGLRFTVPAEFLASATWPIAVDPLITPIAIDTSPIDHYDVDVAFDPTRARYLVVFTEVFSATDHDVKSWLVDASGAVLTATDRYFDLTSVHRTTPRVALTNVRRAFLCVYVEGTSARRIGARSRLADSSALGARFVVDQGTGVDRLQADVCGDSYAGSPNDAHFTVVWRRYWDPSDSDVVARVVHEDGVPQTGELYVTNFVGVSDEAPSISKCIAPGSQDSVVVWRRDDAAYASVISYDGGSVRAEIPLATASGPMGAPQVSGFSTATLLGSAHPTFVAVWDTDYGTDRDVEAVVVAAASSVAAPLVSDVQYLTFLEHVDFALDQREPDVACVGDRWIVVQNATFPGALDSVTRATTVGIVATELGVSERFLALTQTYEETFSPRTASEFEAGVTGSLRALTAWDQLVGFMPPGTIHGAVHAAAAAPACAIQFTLCWGNPNGSFPYSRSFLWVEGDSSTTATKRLHALDMHQSAFGYFLVAPQVSLSGGVTPPGSVGVLCLSGSIGRYASTVLDTGAAGTFWLDLDPTAIPQPTGAVAALAGQLWFFQAWHRDVRPGGGPPTSNFTNAAGVPFF